MGLSMEDTFLAKYYREKWKEEGLKEGKTEIAIRLLKKGNSVQDVAEVTGLTLQEVEELNGIK